MSGACGASVTEFGRDTSKWLIEKCRRSRSIWHVYGPIPPHEPDEWFISYDGEFRTGASAIAFVDGQLRS